MAVNRAKVDAAPFDPDETVPPALKIAAAYSWRILLVLGALAVFVFLFIQVRYIAIPFMISVLIAALLVPFVQWLQRHRWPKWLAVTIALLGTLAAVAGLIVVVVWQVREGFPDLQNRSIAAYEDFRAWLAASPFAISNAELDAWIASVIDAIQSDAVISGALSVSSTTGHVFAGILLTLFATLFILIDGKGIWAWIVNLFPKRARSAVDGSGRAGWSTLTTFVKVQIFVAAVDAIGHRTGCVDPRPRIRRLPAGDPDRDRGVPRLVHPDRRRGRHGGDRVGRRPGLPRARSPRCSCSGSCCSCSRSRGTCCSRS